MPGTCVTTSTTTASSRASTSSPSSSRGAKRTSPRRTPNFHFRSTPLRNDAYNPNDSLPSTSEFVFPYEDDQFDFVAANSVFTHLLPDAAANYVREAGRVLRPGGIACTTWFLLDDDGYTTPFAGPLRPIPVQQWIRQEPGDHAVFDLQNPEAGIAYTADAIRDMFKDAKLDVQNPCTTGTGGIRISSSPRSPNSR